MTSIRCGGFQPKLQEEEKEEAGISKEKEEEPELVGDENLGEIPVAINTTALLEVYLFHIHNIERLDLKSGNKT